MCGLAALFDGGRSFSTDLLEGMSADLHHRGPDSGGILNEPGTALIFRRLAILDPTPAADQPMSDSENRCTLIFNGEIYNYRALRKELQDAGVKLRTDGDTEAILEGYRIWGEGILDRLEGMFAFVLVDRREGVAFVARDPLGIKPLYALRRGSLFAVASEMRPLYRLLPPEPDEAALAELLTFGWAAGGLSNIKGIERVPGGTVFRVPLAGGGVRSRRFFDPLDTLRPDDTISQADAVEAASDALEQSVKHHLASDVGYTAQLSGGVDSSLVAAIVAKQSDRSLATYGVRLEDAAYDEGAYRARVVSKYGLDHTEVTLTGSAFADAMATAVRHMEGPVPHGGCVSLMLLCGESRKRSKVVLTGEGADEMFGGYLRYALWPKLQKQERISKIIPPQWFPPIWPFLNIRRIGGRDAAVHSAVYHDFAAMQNLFPGLIPKPGAREAASRRFTDFRERLFAIDQSAYLESLLVRQDKMSMSQSVEARVPYVHLPLLKVVNRFPRDVRAPGGVTKPVLKRIADRFLPHDVVHRRKVGLRLPYDNWIQDDKALGRYLPMLTEANGRLGAYAEAGAMSRIVEAFRAGRRAGLPSLFWLINIELWLRSIASES